MTRTIIETDCDRCLKKNVPVREIRLETCRDSDPAGGASLPGGIEFDLCIDCLTNIVNKIYKDTPYTVNEQFVNNFGIKQKRKW